VFIILEEKRTEQEFVLNGNGLVKDDGKAQYTVFANDERSDEEFTYTVEISDDIINSSIKKGGFAGDVDKAMEKIKEIAFENAIIKVNNRDYEDKTFIYSIIEEEKEE